MEKYDRIGIGYNNTRKADPYLVDRMFELLDPELGQYFLDIGCGTGNYTIALAQKGLDFIGIDPSYEMLRQAREKNSEVKWIQGKAEDLPLPDDSVDGILCTLSIHHWSDLDQCFKELKRVLKAKGKFVLFTSTPDQMRGYWLNHYFPNTMKASSREMQSTAEVKRALESSGLELIASEKYMVQPDLQDLFLYSGKFQPERYFDEQLRRGISSFASLGDGLEIEAGLEQLRIDVKSGKIDQIRDQYENEKGDYLFMISQAT